MAPSLQLLEILLDHQHSVIYKKAHIQRRASTEWALNCFLIIFWSRCVAWNFYCLELFPFLLSFAFSKMHFHCTPLFIAATLMKVLLGGLNFPEWKSRARVAWKIFLRWRLTLVTGKEIPLNCTETSACKWVLWHNLLHLARKTSCSLNTLGTNQQVWTSGAWVIWQ